MVDVTTTVVVGRPRDLVAEYASDPSHVTEWYANIHSVAWITDPKLAVGSRIAFVARFLGRELRYTYEVVAYEPSELFVMRTAEGPFPMETTYTWNDHGAGATEMTLRNRGEPAGFSKLVAPLMAPAMRRANRKDLRRLKAILERS
jgi:uncharacterized membrane protein